ncbi:MULTISPECIES: LPS translocon maturation chaperone LptM [Gammaproteobacteria]|jgi:diaminopimelate decarboxylase|uniref:LPS translocon maturation chaperone LptM n=1 Tax=Gammaproteobacteria TaxID=1236 RepID=UPI0011280E5D|nr:lipoprotein [Pseudomonas sp. Hp2]
MSTKSSSVRIALAGATFLALAACGNKGPLVMPQKPVPVEAQPATPVPEQTPPAQAEPTQTEPASPTTPAPTDGTPAPVDGKDGQ